MASEDLDPRKRPLLPTAEEIEEWAGREHRRRTAWLAGPSEADKHDWARRYRWRASLGLEESRLGPLPEEIDRWAGAERQRRAAWLAGPSEAEQQRWAQQQRRNAGNAGDDPAPAPSAEDIAEWAARERQRRAQWAAGPSDEEKQEWARRQSGGWADDLLRIPAMLESELPATARDFARQAQLASEGVVYAIARAPMSLWSYLVRAGRHFEDEFYDKPRRRRVRY